jgi:hypothetical protein
MAASATRSKFSYADSVQQEKTLQALSRNQSLLTPTELRLALLLISEGGYSHDIDIPDALWLRATRMSPKSKHIAAVGLALKGFQVKGEGKNTRFRLDLDDWRQFCLASDPNQKPHVAQKRAPAKPGQMIHPECREHGCCRAREEEAANLVSIDAGSTSAAVGRALQKENEVSCQTNSTMSNSKTTTDAVQTAEQDPTKNATTIVRAWMMTNSTTTRNPTNPKPTTTSAMNSTTSPNNSADHAENQREEVPTTAEQNNPGETNRGGGATQQTAPVRGFQEFIGLFLAAGKAINDRDLILAEKRWTALPLPDQLSALKTAKYQLEHTADEHFIPLPQNFLGAKPWTRAAPPRSLPAIHPKTDRAKKRHDEMMEILEARHK